MSDPLIYVLSISLLSVFLVYKDRGYTVSIVSEPQTRSVRGDTVWIRYVVNTVSVLVDIVSPVAERESWCCT